MTQFLGIIPARYASTRFPGKPLAMIHGKSMIHRVYQQASKVLQHVYVATDDTRIEDEVKRFGGKVIMTSPFHQSGTDRCAEALSIFQKQNTQQIDVVINIQGDEPFIQPEQIEKLMRCFDAPDAQIATLVKQIHGLEIFDPNHVKVVISKGNFALYFSRSPIPYLRGENESQWPSRHPFLKHIGIYAYRTSVLEELTTLQQTSLEIAESLEQLRWLENGYKIRVEQTEFESLSVDTPDDLNKINTMIFPD